VAYSDDPKKVDALRAAGITDDGEIAYLIKNHDIEMQMLRRTFDARKATAAFVRMDHKGSKNIGSAFGLMREILFLDPAYKKWFESYAEHYGLSDIEAEIHIEAVAEGLFDDKEPHGSFGERKIFKELSRRNIAFIREYSCDGLRYVGRLRFDFYLPDHCAVIEFHGAQHYQSVPYFGGEDGLLSTQRRDAVKKAWCEKNSIRFFCISHDEDLDRSLGRVLNQIGV